MLPAPEKMLASSALDFYKANQPLAAAILFAEAAQLAPNNAEVLCGLGSALARSAGALVRRPFFEKAAQAFHRCIACSNTGPHAEICKEWLAELRAEIDVAAQPPLDPADLPALLDFLHVQPGIVEDAIDGLGEDNAMGVIMAVGAVPILRFLPVLLAAVEGRWGASAARSALKRVVPFGDRPEIRAAMERTAASPLAAELEPYLSFAMRGDVPARVEFVPAQPAPEPPAKKPWWKI